VLFRAVTGNLIERGSFLKIGPDICAALIVGFSWWNRKMEIFVPFDLEVYKSLNGNHPLLSSLVQNESSNCMDKFIRSHEYGQRTVESTLLDCANFARDVRKDMPERFDQRRDEADDFIANFVASRYLGSQLKIPKEIISFHHTAPAHVQQSDWIIHIESISQIFSPFIGQGIPLDSRFNGLYDNPAFWIVRSMLENSKCKAIFSNIMHTVDQCREVFKSDLINEKLHHIPAGPWFSKTQEEIIQRGLASRRDDDNIRVLFTNSWHDGETNFVLRGGLALVLGFLEIANVCPRLELTIRSSVPESIINSQLGQVMKSHPRINIIDKSVSEDEIINIYAESDIFYLNSSALHSLSLLRAMYCGLVCLVSDAPGIDEYCEGGSTALVVRGRRALVNGVDAQSGWVFDDYTQLLSSPFTFHAEEGSKIARFLKDLYQSGEMRSQLSHMARTRVMSSNRFDQWKGGFSDLLRRIDDIDRYSALQDRAA
jgi:glycosyltransferase involved in cell wall biosynthesis